MNGKLCCLGEIFIREAGYFDWRMEFNHPLSKSFQIYEITQRKPFIKENARTFRFGETHWTNNRIRVYNGMDIYLNSNGDGEMINSKLYFLGLFFIYEKDYYEGGEERKDTGDDWFFSIYFKKEGHIIYNNKNNELWSTIGGINKITSPICVTGSRNNSITTI
jgi:hypothetical protein